MARSTKKSLAGQAASAARRVMSRGKSGAAKAAEAAPAAKKTAAKKTGAAKKTAAKKAGAAKKTAAKKTGAAKKTAAKKTGAKKTGAAKKAGAKKTPGKKATVSKAVKTTATPASAGSLVVQEGEKQWSAEELAEVVGELHEQRAHSLEIIGEQENELSGLLRDSGDGAGHDQADMGATSFERDHELSVLNNEHDKLAQIDRALARIDDGSYGQCESCGQPIGKMRLMAFPRATLCMTCKQREERR